MVSFHFWKLDHQGLDPSKSKTHRISNPQIVIFPRYILKEIDQIYIQKVQFSPNFNPRPKGTKGPK